MPYAKVLERAAIPNKADIVNAVKAIVPAALVGR
jgi:pyruvate/2-oxoglutarate/acetoin dehydrogenase E1 component